MCNRDSRPCLLAVERQKEESRCCIFLKKHMPQVLVIKKTKKTGQGLQVFLQSWGSLQWETSSLYVTKRRSPVWETP